MKSLILIGAGGHCRSCIDVIEAGSEYSVLGVVDSAPSGSTDVMGYPIIGYDSDLQILLEEADAALVAIGQLGQASDRVRLFESLVSHGVALPVITSPTAQISQRSSLGRGSVVMHGVVIGPSTAVGENCIVNSQALLEHDVSVGSHTHISTGARVNGGVSIGARCFVGSGAVIHQGVRIADNCVVAAGTTVRRDLLPGTSYRG